MGILGLWLAALGLAVLVGALLGWVAFFRGRALERELQRLQRDMAILRAQSASPPGVLATAKIDPRPTTEAPAARELLASGTGDGESLASKSGPTDEVSATPGSFASHAPVESPPAVKAPQRPLHGWLQHLISHWMVWLGGLCVGLAGIFMVRYSIEAGLLGPRARVALAIATGIGLHVVAEWLHRRGGSDPSFAALAGGASITLYGALLAAMHLYQLLDPRAVFVLLALVSLATMVLALMHGPFLAGIGILGAFVVPILVSTGSGNIAAALAYSLIVSAAGLALLRFVYRPWLWWGLLAGSLGWWFISLTSSQGDGLRGPYLAALTWCLVAIPAFDWLLRGNGQGGASDGVGNQRVLVAGRSWRLDQVSLGLLVLAWGWSIAHQGGVDGAFAHWAPLVVVLAFAARHRDHLAFLPWLSLAAQWLAWLTLVLHYDVGQNRWLLEALPTSRQGDFLVLAGAMAALYSGLALLHLRSRGFSHPWLSLACLAPLVWLALAYLLVSDLHQSLNWTLLAVLAGLLYGVVAGLRLQRAGSDSFSLWFVLAGAAIVSGGLWRQRRLYRAGLGLLGVVIAKIFLVDMSGLEGLLRVASFMGLGLGLLALAWLHRRVGGAPAIPSHQGASG